MANVNNLYPSNYLKAADLQGRTAKVNIARVVTETIGHDEKAVLYFQGKEKGMVMNKTNGMTIAQMYGPETDDWAGGEIELYPTMVDFQGKQVEAVRVRIPPRAPTSRPTNVVPNARDRAAMAAQASQAEPDLDDDIPF